MSLQVWLPLNGHFNNYGLSGATTSLVNAPAVINSNRGKCYNFNPNNENNQGIELNIPNMPQWIQSEFSIAFWVYHRKTAGRSIIFGNFNLGTSYAFNVEKMANSNALRIYMQAKPDQTVSACVLPENTWTHVTITKSKTGIEVFKNGSSVYTRAHTGTDLWSSADGVKYRIGRDGRSDATSLNGMVSDFRIYDHVLSTKEIKELSKGLILNYAFDNPYNIATTNLINVANGTFTKNANSAWHQGLTCPKTYVTPGKTYVWSFEVQQIKGSNTYTAQFDANCTDENGVYTGNDATMSSSVTCGALTIPKNGNWLKCWIKATIQTDAGKPYLHHTFCPNVTAEEAIFAYRNVMLEETSDVNPFTPYGEPRDGILEDVSGFGNHGSLIGNCRNSTDTDKGNYSLWINPASPGVNTATGAAYTRSPLSLSNVKNFTIAANVKMNTWGSQVSGLFSFSFNGSAPGDYQASFNHRDSAFDFKDTAGTVTRLSLGTDDLPAKSNWTHIAITFNGTNLKLYKNGVFVREKVLTTAADWVGCEYLYLSYSQAGGVHRICDSQFSDFRFYTTTLSDVEIKKLAEKDAAVDPDGNYYCFGLDEKFDITHNLSTTGIMNTGVDYDFVNMYPGIQSTTATAAIGITYNYETDIFKDYGFNTCTKFTAKNTTATDKFLAYSYIMPIFPYVASGIYTFSCYAYMPSSCNADLHINLEQNCTWVKNYQGTTSNIIDTTKNKVIKVWGTIKANSSGLMYLMFYPNPNVAGVFTKGEFYIAGMTVYKGNTHQHPVNQAFSSNLIKTMVAGGRTTLNGTHSIIADFSQNADTYARFNFYEPLEFDKTYQLSFTVDNFPSGSKWTWNLFNKSQYSFLVDRNGTYCIIFKPKADYMTTADLQDMLFDDGARTTPTGKVNFNNFKIVECLGGSNHAIFETNKSAIHPEYVEMNRYYEFI